MHETIICSCSLLYNILLCGCTIIYSTTDGHPPLPALLLLQTALQWRLLRQCTRAEGFQGTQLSEHCWVTGYAVSTLVHGPPLFSQRACSSWHSDFPVPGRNTESCLGECCSCRRGCWGWGTHMPPGSSRSQTSRRGGRGVAPTHSFQQRESWEEWFFRPLAWGMKPAQDELDLFGPWTEHSVATACFSHGGGGSWHETLFPNHLSSTDSKTRLTSLRTRIIFFHLVCICKA